MNRGYLDFERLFISEVASCECRRCMSDTLGVDRRGRYVIKCFAQREHAA